MAHFCLLFDVNEPMKPFLLITSRKVMGELVSSECDKRAYCDNEIDIARDRKQPETSGKVD